MNDYCVFILTHGRPNKVITYKSLRNQGYTGPIYIIIDDEDKTAEQYKKIYGSSVIMFSKEEIAKKFDEGGRFKDRRSIVYARNACFDIAESLGYKYFIQLDDDYSQFDYKFDGNHKYCDIKIKDIDSIFNYVLDYYKQTSFSSIAMSQGGDFIGGKESSLSKHIKTKRKAMNSFFCSTERRFKFIGRINEDVNTYTASQRSGLSFLTLNQICLRQLRTQSNTGGMTAMYLDSGTYVKSFYSVMYAPSCVLIKDMGDNHRRIHHAVSFDKCAPKIVHEKWRR